MAVQTVPYALQNASHGAAVFRQSASAAFATGGTLGTAELAVTQQSTPNMSVILGAGRAKVPGTSVSPPSGFTWTTQAMYDVLNDAPVTLTIATSSPTLPRIDTVYIGVQDSFYSGTNNQAIAGVVTGTPAGTPTAPAAPTNAIPIAYVAVAANATTIVNANISAQTVVASLLPSSSTGMTRVIPTGVSGTGASLGPNGAVTLSNVGSSGINIAGCFTSQYDTYEIIITIPSSSSLVGLNAQLSAGGTASTAANYDAIVMSGSASSAAAATLLAGTSWALLGNNATLQSIKLTLYRPALADATTGIQTVLSTGNPGVSGTMVISQRGYLHRLTNSYDGLFLATGSGTCSGTVRIYGYNNN